MSSSHSSTNSSHSGSLSSTSSTTCSHLRLYIPLSQTRRNGGNGVKWLAFILTGDSLACIIMRNDKSIHTKLFLSPCTFVASSEAEYLRLSQPDDGFPTHLSLSHFYPKHPHKSSFSLSISPVSAGVPCFPLGCPVGCVNVPFWLCNNIS